MSYRVMSNFLNTVKILTGYFQDIGKKILLIYSGLPFYDFAPVSFDLASLIRAVL